MSEENAKSVFGPETKALLCAWHVIKNIQKDRGAAADHGFMTQVWNLVKAPSQAEYSRILTLLTTRWPRLAERVLLPRIETSGHRWIPALYEEGTFNASHNTSGVSESGHNQHQAYLIFGDICRLLACTANFAVQQDTREFHRRVRCQVDRRELGLKALERLRKSRSDAGGLVADVLASGLVRIRRIEAAGQEPSLVHDHCVTVSGDSEDDFLFECNCFSCVHKGTGRITHSAPK